MKLAKRLSALFICVVMLVSCCVFTNAATASVTMTNTYAGHNITSGGEVVWTQYNVYGGNTGHTEEVNILEFNPEDGYIPMVFQNYAGSVNKLSAQYNTAVNKYGYEVAGIINGSFFGVANSTLSGNAVSNGRLICAHNDWSSEMVAFDSNGKMNVVSSQLSYAVYINGQEFPNSIRYVNKRFETDGYKSGKFYYYDTSCGTVADSATTGYQILCKKIDNSDLTIGGTLFAEVIEVQVDQAMCKFDTVGEESDNFVLYCESTSTYVPYIKDLKAGDSIAITVNETIEASREVMEKANSVITNVGWLVKDGVDLTETNSTIGSHNVNTTYARWTAFGTKPDGTYVFLTSDGGSTGTSTRSLSLREVAATMMKLGCNNVIRMDGGGSSSMYTSNLDGSGTPGYIFKTEDRAVADCILIVKKTSAQDADLNTALKSAIASAKESVAATPNAALSEYIAEAEAAVASGVILESDALRLLANLSGKGELRDLIKRASDISYKEYSESVLSVIRAAYDDAIDAYFGSGATAKEIAEICATLSENLDNSSYKNLSKGKSYTTTKPNRGDDFDDDGARLTNGSKSNAEGGSPTNYSGWGATTYSVDVIVDLGSKQNSNTYTVYGASNFWGISAINSLKISVSDDGSSFTEVGSSKDAIVVGSGVEVDSSVITLSAITVKADEIQNARYVKFTVASPKFVWIDEVEVGIGGDTTGKSVGDAVEVHGFNQYIYDSDCYIYTPDFGELTATKINHRYTTNVILEATEAADEWKIVSIVTNNGTAAKITLEDNQIMIACHKGKTSASGISEEILKNAKAGQTLKFYGIDVANKSIGVAAYIQLKGGSGDVNNDGAINQYDYILVKRHYFGTRTLTSDEMTRADANADGTVNQFDYILICRHYFGTYVIGG